MTRWGALLFVSSFCLTSAAHAQERPRAALIAHDRVPPETVRVLVSTLSEHADVMPDDQVRVAADDAAIELDAVESTGELIHALDVALLVRARVGARRRLELTFHEPAAGSEFLAHRVVLARGGHLPEDASLELAQVMQDAVAAGAAVAEGGDVGDAPGSDTDVPEQEAPTDDEGDDADPAGALSTYAAAAVGVGLRDLEITRDGRGPLTLGASFFPTVSIGLGARHDGIARGRLVLRLDATYRTSVGLVTEEPDQDGSLRSIDSRAHDLVATVGLRYRVTSSERAVSFGADVGVRWAAFELARPAAVPSTSYLGPIAMAVLDAPFGSRRVVGTIALGVHLALTTGGIARLVSASSAPIVLARASLRFDLGSGFGLSVAYDEVHALMSDASDTDRRADLALSFTP